MLSTLLIVIGGLLFAFAMRFFLDAFDNSQARKAARRKSMLCYRDDDGKNVSVRALGCGNCKNFAFFTHVDIELPRFCAYCGIRFNRARTVTEEERREAFPL